MKISKLIRKIQEAQDKYGDLPVYANEADIAEVEVRPCGKDSTVIIVGGKQETPTEFYLEFIPA